MDSPPHLVKLWQQWTEPGELSVQVLSRRDYVELLSVLLTLLGDSETIHSGETMNTVRLTVEPLLNDLR